MNICDNALKNDEYWMLLALKEAEKAKCNGEIPVGAVIVQNNTLIACAHNERENRQDVTGHAEIIAIQKASAALGRWRLDDCNIYITLEPCLMCSGAIIQARLKTLIYGADNPKAGMAGSISNVFNLPHNHDLILTPGILKAECSLQLKQFFQEKRHANKHLGSRSQRRCHYLNRRSKQLPNRLISKSNPKNPGSDTANLK